MLNEEFREGTLVWLKDDICKYRIEEDGNWSVVWINYKGYDISRTILLWDFQKQMDESDISLKLNSNWTRHFGFEIDKDDVLLFIGLVECFISKWDPADLSLQDQYNDWYTKSILSKRR